ncbi:MAG: amidase [Bryobacteraceae bacterium]|nr:amidase [Bryobacteraceae bacterium]
MLQNTAAAVCRAVVLSLTVSPGDLTRRGALLGLPAAILPAARLASGPDVCFLSAAEMARLIRLKKLSAREALDAHLRQIERVNPKVNAIVTLVPEMAAEAAQRADEALARGEAPGPLHGLPIAHKDLVETKGIRTAFGSPLFKDNFPANDDLIVQRLRRAGAITIGKTNTPEYGAGSQTFNTVFGATRNPYDTSKTCGGSSGGAAVALACGMIPLADGSDMGGSLRNPAAYCNIVGFRVSPGRVPNPAAAFAWSTLSTAGPMARSVSDVALLLSVLAGPDPRSPLSLPELGTAFLRPLGRSFKGVRIAWFKDLGGIPFDPRVRSAVDAQRKVFESLGCGVEQAEPDFSGADYAFKTLRAWNSATTHAERFAASRDAYKDTLRREIEDGLRLTGSEAAKAQILHGQLWRRFQTFLQQYEYFILPTTQLPPFDVNLPYPTEVNGILMHSYIDWMKSCWYISLTGNPAISVPAGFTPEGLPVGIQIVGRHHADFSVLQLAHAFEQATRFGLKRPPAV